MLYGGLRESNENEGGKNSFFDYSFFAVVLVDTPAEAFKVFPLIYLKAILDFQILLKYIYTGRVQLRALDFNRVLDMLGLVHKYGFTELETAIPDYLKVAD